MGVLAFLVTVAYIPGITGMTIPTGWAIMSIFLPFAAWRGATITPLHLVGLGFLAYACLSLAWTPEPYFGIFHLWQLACIALAFVLGSRIEDPRPILIGLALGISVSSAVCVAQFFGYSPVLMNWVERPSGLMYNSVAMAMSATLVLIWLLVKRMWWFALGVAPAVVLTQSRGALIALAVVALIRQGWWFGIVVLGLLAGLFVFGRYPEISDSLRVALWIEGVKHLSIFGSGAGAIESVYLDTGGQLLSPEHLHNEYLDFLFHFGVFGLAAIAVMLAPLIVADKPEWYPYVGFLIMAIYSFPLHSPVPAFIGAVLAGHLARGWSLAWEQFNRRRFGFLTRDAYG